jgi:hypothetical protein
MKTAMGSLLTAVVLVSGCGPASNGPAASVSDARAAPSSSSAQTTQTPTVTRGPVVAPGVHPAAPKVTSPTRTQAATPKPAAAGTALAAVAGLSVRGRAPKTGYTRAQFGQSWFDTDRNGCDTRNDILRRDLGSRQMKNACKVLAGTLAPDPYTGASIRLGVALLE